MKAELEVVLEGNVRLPLSGKVETLADVAKLGMKLVALARNVRRQFPDFATLPVKSLKIKNSGE
jgi:hypothetical protein